MKKYQYVLLFVFCVAITMFFDVRDVESFKAMFTLHPADYLLLVFWAGLMFLLILPVIALSDKLAVMTEKMLQPAKKIRR